MKLHPELEVLVTPLEAKDKLLGPTVTIHLQGCPRLLVSEEDFAKVQALLGSDMSGRQVMLAPAEDDDVRISIRLVPS
jgi:hypothetical protein